MLSALIYLTFEFFDTIYVSYLVYIRMPSEGYSRWSADVYGYMLALANLLGLLILWLSLYRKTFISHRVYILPLIFLSVLSAMLSQIVALMVMLLFVVVHTAFTYYYEVLALKFEKFETLIGLSYSAGFAALGLMLFLSHFDLLIAMLLYCLSLVALMFVGNLNFAPSIPSKRELLKAKFLAEVVAVCLMGEYAEVLTGMGYYIIRDTMSSGEALMERAMGLALLSAFVASIISGSFLQFIGIRNLGVISTLLMLSMPLLFYVFPTHIYIIASLAGISIALYWVYFRTYLYYRYPLQEYLYRFLFFYFASNLGGLVLYSLLFGLTGDHKTSLLVMSALLIPVLFIQLRIMK